MAFEFNPSKILPPEEGEPDLEQLIEEEKTKIRSQNPERFALFEKFISFDKKTLRLLPLNIRERYGELEEDWFNISDVCDRMGGEEKYRKIISDIEGAIAERRVMVGSLRERMSEIGRDRLRAYFNMHQEEDDVYERGLFAMLDASKDQSVFDRYSFELIVKIADEVENIDTAAVDQWIEQQKIVARQTETRQLKAEKARVLKWLQQMHGSEWKLIVTLCQKLSLMKEIPKNGEMLNYLQPQDLLTLEKRFHDVENKLREYDMHLYSSSEEDLETVIEEVLQSASE